MTIYIYIILYTTQNRNLELVSARFCRIYCKEEKSFFMVLRFGFVRFCRFSSVLSVLSRSTWMLVTFFIDLSDLFTLY